MNCPIESGGNASYLLDYAAGKLDAAAREQVARHVEQCAACRKVTGGQVTVWQALDAWEPAEVSMDFDRRLFARIEQQPLSWWSRLTLPVSAVFRHAVPIGATAAVILMAGLLMLRPTSAPVTESTHSAQVEALQPDQVQRALDDMEMLRDLNHLISADASDSKM
jgi:anti-sigma factor RsiW